ncbi:phosphatase PAP2 family protein [Vitiosangium sp. GDMCC 1.1324]|uniref:phosphatase PAP2 family protein n=1 Tax=Vitiosangium sp. (strain GDMCC 1.1324) TaxID=2138576 RepID=UPI000D332343|nr:phosphatase PAP2 family protein [Vitiosangium sp. GDMCC 1.1324]PTL81745.1 phosphatidic acid phosphatase [Vitiosangium sp. GDMCC 1.1324]
MPLVTCALVVAALLTSSPVPPEEAVARKQSPTLHALKFDWRWDGAGTAALAGVLVTGLVFKEQLAPTGCHLCDYTVEGGDRLGLADRWGRTALRAQDGEDRRVASDWSDVVGNAVLPVGMLGAEFLMVAASDAPWPWLAEDALIITESLAFSTLVNTAVKYGSARMRPYAYARYVAGENPSRLSAADLSSFYSGHTSFAFSLVVTVGTLAELRGYPGRWLVWTVGLPLAALVGSLRMVSDKHYLTDVLVGSLAGSALGVAVPLVLHGRKPSPEGVSLRVTMAPGGAALVGRF